MMKNIIVAYDKNYGIGANNDLLWNGKLPADMAHFKQITIGHPIIMGYRTYESIGKPLPNRRNVIISHDLNGIGGFEVFASLAEALKACENDQEVFVIGGGKIFAEAIELVDKIISTEVDAIFSNATVFFPEIDKNIWKETSREHHDSDERNLFNYDFVTYIRV